MSRQGRFVRRQRQDAAGNHEKNGVCRRGEVSVQGAERVTELEAGTGLRVHSETYLVAHEHRAAAEGTAPVKYSCQAEGVGDEAGEAGEPRAYRVHEDDARRRVTQHGTEISPQWHFGGLPARRSPRSMPFDPVGEIHVGLVQDRCGHKSDPVIGALGLPARSQFFGDL
jgi:hypothetical protein